MRAADLTASGTPARSAVQVQRSSFQGGLPFSGMAMRRLISMTSSPHGAETVLLEKLPEPGTIPVHGVSGLLRHVLLLVTL